MNIVNGFWNPSARRMGICGSNPSTMSLYAQWILSGMQAKFRTLKAVVGSKSLKPVRFATSNVDDPAHLK